MSTIARQKYQWHTPDPSSNRKAAVATLLVQIFLLFLLLTFGFVTPLPLPGEEGIEISFGDNIAAGGGGPTMEAVPLPPAPIKEREQQHLTQDFEEAPAIKAPPPKRSQPEPTPTPTEQKPKPTQVEQPKPREVDQSALFPGSQSKSPGPGKGEGDQTGTQGTPDGLKYEGGSGTGNAQDGHGTGSGKGGPGSGVSYKLGNRVALRLPAPEYPKQKSGKVVVKVWVDTQGKITRAEPGQPGSTTFDQTLLNAAKRAALQGRFDVDTKAPQTQVGTITYVFQLKQ